MNQELVDKFNEIMAHLNCPLHLLTLDPAGYITSYAITLKNTYMVKNNMIYPTDEFYQMMERYFETHGIKLSYNNTRTTIWGKQSK